MLSEEKMHAVMNEAMANLLADAVYNRILAQLQPQWDKITEELVISRKTNATVAVRLSTLENLVKQQVQQTETMSVERAKIRETALACLQILKDAKQSLGLE